MDDKFAIERKERTDSFNTFRTEQDSKLDNKLNAFRQDLKDSQHHIETILVNMNNEFKDIYARDARQDAKLTTIEKNASKSKWSAIQAFFMTHGKTIIWSVVFISILAAVNPQFASWLLSMFKIFH